jgi:hypothetical protein
MACAGEGKFVNYNRAQLVLEYHCGKKAMVLAK